MPESPGQTIDHLRAFMDVVSDPELARKLRIDKSTISSWRSRGSVPNRYRRILSGSDPHAYEMPPATTPVSYTHLTLPTSDLV